MKTFKTEIPIDERNRIEVDDLAGKINLTIYHRMDNFVWVVSGGMLLSPDQAASLGLTLIQRSGKESKILKAKFQRKDY